MLAYLQQYVLYILGAVIVLLLISCGVQTVRLKFAQSAKETAEANLKVKDTQLQAQVAVVQQLVKNGEALTATIETSQKDAAKEKQRLRDELERLKRDKAPKDCEGAASWAKEKATALSGRW